VKLVLLGDALPCFSRRIGAVYRDAASRKAMPLGRDMLLALIVQHQ
jgi:hypothetical protein